MIASPASTLTRLLSTLLLTLAAPACSGARPVVLPEPRHAIDLAPLALVEAEPWVRDDCERMVNSALQRRGFYLDPAGPRVAVEVAFFQYPPDSTYKADFTARVHASTGVRQVMASGEGNAGNLADPRPSGGGRARLQACWVGAERLAGALAEAMTPPALR